MGLFVYLIINKGTLDLILMKSLNLTKFDNFIFDQICMDFFFKREEERSMITETIIFAKHDHLFTLNYNNSQIKRFYKYYSPLATTDVQPYFCKMNDDQDVIILATDKDSKYIDI